MKDETPFCEKQMDTEKLPVCRPWWIEFQSNRYAIPRGLASEPG
jgi:hypothetical protein